MRIIEIRLAIDEDTVVEPEDDDAVDPSCPPLAFSGTARGVHMMRLSRVSGVVRKKRDYIRWTFVDVVCIGVAASAARADAVAFSGDDAHGRLVAVEVSVGGVSTCVAGGSPMKVQCGRCPSWQRWLCARHSRDLDSCGSRRQYVNLRVGVTH